MLKTIRTSYKCMARFEPHKTHPSGFKPAPLAALAAKTVALELNYLTSIDRAPRHGLRLREAAEASVEGHSPRPRAPPSAPGASPQIRARPRSSAQQRGTPRPGGAGPAPAPEHTKDGTRTHLTPNPKKKNKKEQKTTKNNQIAQKTQAGPEGFGPSANGLRGRRSDLAELRTHRPTLNTGPDLNLSAGPIDPDRRQPRLARAIWPYRSNEMTLNPDRRS